MTARASTRGDITEDLTRTTVAGETATGISDSASVILEQAREEIRALLFCGHKPHGTKLNFRLAHKVQSNFAETPTVARRMPRQSDYCTLLAS